MATAPKPIFNILNGGYQGPALETSGIHSVVSHLDGIAALEAQDRHEDGSFKLLIAYPGKTQDKPLKTEASLVIGPDDDDGYDVHVVIGTQFGCKHGCLYCADSLPGSWKGNPDEAHMGYAVRKVLDFGKDALDNLERQLGRRLRIKILHTGSGDPFQNAEHVRVFARNLRNIDERADYVHSSTAGALQFLPVMIEAGKEARENGVTLGIQFSGPLENRSTFMPNPDRDAREQFSAAERYHTETGNPAFVNYVVIPGFDDAQKDAEYVVREIGENTILKLVGLNSVAELDGVSDDKGNMMVLKRKPELEGQKDKLGNLIKQRVIPEFLQAECSRENVLAFRVLVEAEAARQGKIFKIISPEDKAEKVGAHCGHNGKTYSGQAAVLPAQQAIELVV